MYIPPFNLMHDHSEIIEFMRRYNFATIITNKEELPIATHLPFIIRVSNERLRLISHFAKANEQWQYITDRPSLVVFSEPHAYISPSNYEKEQNVPTWNYLAVHVYGKARLIEEKHEVIQILEETISTYEEAYLNQWNGLSDAYKMAMINGIVAFELEVNDIQAKKKLSQNKTQNEVNQIIATLSDSEDSNVKAIAGYMKKM